MYLDLFAKFKLLYKQKDYSYSEREIVYLEHQKIIDATERVKLRHIEKEDALKKVEAYLYNFEK